MPVCVGWLSPRGIFLFVACWFTFVKLLEMGERKFPCYWGLMPAASYWFLQGSEEHTSAAEDPRPVLSWFMIPRRTCLLLVSGVLPM